MQNEVLIIVESLAQNPRIFRHEKRYGQHPIRRSQRKEKPKSHPF